MRDPLKDPKAGDVFRLNDGNRSEIKFRGVMHPDATDCHGIRRGTDYVQYGLSKYPGNYFRVSTTGYKKRVVEVIHAAD